MNNSLDYDQQLDYRVKTAIRVLVSSNSCYRELPVVVIFSGNVPEVIECDLWKTFDDAVKYVEVVRGEKPVVNPIWVSNHS